MTSESLYASLENLRRASIGLGLQEFANRIGDVLRYSSGSSSEFFGETMLLLRSAAKDPSLSQHASLRIGFDEILQGIEAELRQIGDIPADPASN